MNAKAPCVRCWRALQRAEQQTSKTRTLKPLSVSIPRPVSRAPQHFRSSRSITVTPTRPKYLSSPPKPTEGFAGTLATAAPRTTETYVAFGVTSNLFRRCSEQASYFFPQRENKASAEVTTLPSGEELGLTDTDESWWHDELCLPPTFSTWSQHLLDHFTYEAEDKMTVLHNMTSSSIRNKYLKDLYLQWRGILASYDEGLVKGDAVLGAAVWRNLWKADENVDWTKVAQVVAYMRRVIRKLGDDEDGEILAKLSGVTPPGEKEHHLFRKIQKEESLVAGRSRGVQEPLTVEDNLQAPKAPGRE